MYRLRNFIAPLLSRGLAQAAAHQHRAVPPHRQSLKWRSSTPSATARTWPKFTPSHQPSSSASASASSSPSPASSAAETRGQRLLLSYHDLERALERRGLNTARVLLLSASAAALGAILAWPRIKKWGAVEGAEVAAASLETQQLQERAAAMLHDVLGDERTAQQVERLLKDAMLALFRDEAFTGKAVEWSAGVLAEALTWEEVRMQGKQYVKGVFEDRESKKSAEVYIAGAIQSVVADEAVQDSVAQSLWSSVRASLIGRRKPLEAPAPVEQPKAQPAVEQEQTVSQQEALYASSALDEGTKSDALPTANAAATASNEGVSENKRKDAKRDDSG